MLLPSVAAWIRAKDVVPSSRTPELAVEVGLLDLQRLQGLDGARILGRPIEAGSGQELHLAAIDPGTDAEAVELDLVRPIIASRRFAHKAVSAGA